MEGNVLEGRRGHPCKCRIAGSRLVMVLVDFLFFYIFVVVIVVDPSMAE